MNELVALAKRKVGPAPVWVYLVVGILGLAWWLRSRKAKAKTQEDTTNSTGVMDQFALAYPMPYQSDVFVNVTGSTPQNPNTAIPTSIGVAEGTWLSNFLAKVNEKYPGLALTEAKLRELNPGLSIIPANKYGYISATNPSGRAGGGPDVMVINSGSPSTQVRIQ